MGNTNRTVTEPTPRQDGEMKMGDTVAAQDFRRNRVVAKLKKLREDNCDLAELAPIWAAIDLLEN